MIKIKILTIGKTKENWLNEAISLYEKRLSNRCSITWDLVKDETKLIEKSNDLKKIYILDPLGTPFSSETFSETFFKNPESSMTFIIGGDMGIPREITERAAKKISLSPMTFTHQMTRLIVVEQIYRALEIQRGSCYHK